MSMLNGDTGYRGPLITEGKVRGRIFTVSWDFFILTRPLKVTKRTIDVRATTHSNY